MRAILELEECVAEEEEVQLEKHLFLEFSSEKEKSMSILLRTVVENNYSYNSGESVRRLNNVLRWLEEL